QRRSIPSTATEPNSRRTSSRRASRSSSSLTDWPNATATHFPDRRAVGRSTPPLQGAGVGWASVRECYRNTSGHTASVHGRYAGDPAGSERGGTVLRTPRLILIPLTGLDEDEHARASRNAADASRDTRSAEVQWREHGFGPWAIRDKRDNRFLGGAELRFAGDGIEGIAADEVESGWWVTEERRNEGIATEAMEAVIDDLWSRTDAEAITAYIEDEE